MKYLDDYGYETWVEERDNIKDYVSKKRNKFLDSPAWQEMRRKVLDRYGRECMKCGQTKGQIHVDHIKPRFYYPELSLDFNNLQVLCRKCNENKWIDTKDYRKTK